MCDFSLHHVNSRPAKVGGQAYNPRFSHGHSRICGIGGFEYGGLSPARDGVVLCR